MTDCEKLFDAKTNCDKTYEDIQEVMVAVWIK